MVSGQAAQPHRSQQKRQEAQPLPFEMIREAVVNALVHRDYDIREAKIQLRVTPETVVVSSPGGPVPPITLEDLRAFKASMLSRNPEVHYIFSRMGLAEERGLGLRSLQNRAEQAGLPRPRYTFEDPYLVLTIFRNPNAALPEGVTEALNESELQGWRWFAGRGVASASEYGRAVGLEARTARRHLNRFVELGLARKTGAGPATRYEVV